MGESTRKGFTLVELLVTIILLGIIGGIVIYNMTNISKVSKESDYDRFIAEVKSASSVYADMYPEAFNELYVSRAYIYITLNDLVSHGLLDEDLENPFTKEKIDLKELVKASLDSTNGAVTFEYPMTDTNTEQTLVAMSDYVVWGEPYDCMRGIGSYELSLSDEDGTLINLNATDENGVLNKDKYNFTCTLPDSFVSYTNPNTGKVGMRTTEAGNYEIKYNWVTESGVRKEATRILRVLAKVKPTFKMNVSDYDFGNDVNIYENKFIPCSNCDSENFYQTSLNADGTWNVLKYKPLIEGADSASTVVKVTKRQNDPSLGAWENVTNGFVPLDSLDEKQVDDGDKTYKLDVIVSGHYDEDYQYDATGEGRLKSELVVPLSYITAEKPDSWSTDNVYKISSDDTNQQSPVGIKKYEYKLTNDEDVNKRTNQIVDNLFDKTATITEKDVTLMGGTTCTDKAVEYKYVYFRAINKEGYAGKWTRYSTYLTNQLTRIIEQNSKGCTNANNCCLPTSGSCYFQNKVLFVKFRGQLFNVLERYSDGSVMLTLDTNTGVRVSPLELRHGYASQQTCDGLFYKNYTYYVANNAIMNEAIRWANATFSGTNKLLTPAVPGYPSYSVYTYNTSLLGKYKSAAYASPDYWLLNQGYYSETIYLDQPHKHANESTTAYNAFFYYAYGTTYAARYGGGTSFVKPIVRTTNMNICSGNGTKGSPYVLAG